MILLLMSVLLSICSITAADDPKEYMPNYVPVRMIDDHRSELTQDSSAMMNCLFFGVQMEDNSLINVLSRTAQIVLAGVCIGCCLGVCCAHEYVVDTAQKVMALCDEHASKRVFIMQERCDKEKKQ